MRSSRRESRPPAVKLMRDDAATRARPRSIWSGRRPVTWKLKLRAAGVRSQFAAPSAASMQTPDSRLPAVNLIRDDAARDREGQTPGVRSALAVLDSSSAAIVRSSRCDARRPAVNLVGTTPRDLEAQTACGRRALAVRCFERRVDAKPRTARPSAVKLIRDDAARDREGQTPGGRSALAAPATLTRGSRPVAVRPRGRA
jgi:hypothetical protein